MGAQQFGGPWTEQKLRNLRQYLNAYVMALSKFRDRWNLWYVEGFSGSGERVDSNPNTGNNEYPLLDVAFSEAEPNDLVRKGSARIALEIEPAFDRFLFIDIDTTNCAALRDLIRENYARLESHVQIEQGDANETLRKWCEETDWDKNRAVVFLDPFAMGASWSLIETIAKTHAIDLWYLFPLSAVNRCLTTKERPPDEWCKPITRVLGTDEWWDVFYDDHGPQTLFGLDDPVEQKTVTLQRLADFFNRRLATVFEKVAPKPLLLKNSTGAPIFSLCFAAGNKTGAPIAVRIADHILKA